MPYGRRSIRLPGYDYSQSGLYFITICTINKICLFGNIVNGIVYPNKYGEIVKKCWIWLAIQYPYVNLDFWVLMPDHLHGIINIKHQHLSFDRRGGSRTAPTTSDIIKSKPLGRLIGAFKTVSTKKINQIRNTPGSKLWQRGYYERIIRDQNALRSIRRYIINNPLNWHKRQ